MHDIIRKDVKKSHFLLAGKTILTPETPKLKIILFLDTGTIDDRIAADKKED